MFQVGDAGALYFRNIDALLARPDSHDLGDVLEVYLLALLLGFRGNRAKDPQSLHNYRDILATRIRRIRSSSPAVSPYPDPRKAPANTGTTRDKRIVWIAGGAAAGAILLFLLFKVILLLQVYSLKALVAGARP